MHVNLRTDLQRRLVLLPEWVGVALLYAALAKVVLVYCSANGVVSIVWPPSGLALAVVLLGGRRQLPGVFLGALVANAMTGLSLWLAAFLSVGSTLEALLGAWLLTRDGRFDRQLWTLSDYLRLIVLAGCVSPSLSALTGSTALLLSGFFSSADHASNLAHWWMGDALGIIVLAPLVLVWRRPPDGWLEPKRLAEAVFLHGLTFVVGQAVFLGRFHGPFDLFHEVARGYWVFLCITWVAVRLGTHGVVISITATMIQALWGSLLGLGYFADDLSRTQLVNVWFYVVVLSIVGMALATYFAGHERMVKLLRLSAENLHRAQAVGEIGSWRVDLPTGRLEWSAETHRMFGIPQSEAITVERSSATVHPDDRKAVSAAWAAALTGATFDLEHRIVVNGQTRWVRERAQVERDAAGRPKAVIGTAQEITERKRIDLEMRVAAIAFETQEGMVVTDAKGVILRVNRAFTQLTGYAAEEAVGKTPRLLRSGRHDKAFYSAMWESLARNETWHGEVWNRRKSGEVYPEWLTITAVKGDAGEISHYVATMVDITQRKAADEEIKLLAFYDPLTRLPNRRLLLERLQQALATSARTVRQKGLLFIDLDNFKTLNDTLGHDKGDLLLQQVAQRIVACVREGDTVSRLGGDEFVVVLEELSEQPGQALDQARLVAEKILAALNRGDLLPGFEHRNSASIGVTLFRGRDERADALLSRADLAMYRAKAAGRNTVRVVGPDESMNG